MPKYGALAARLAATPSSELNLTFAEIDELVDGLPASARDHRPWWGNASGSTGQAKSWMDVGWRVDAVDLAGGTVRFKQISGDGEQKVRAGLLYRNVLEILDEYGTTPRSDALALLAERVALTPYELEPAGQKSIPRYQPSVSWGSAEMSAAGWLEKSNDGWRITDAGRQALATITDDDEISRKARQAWKEHDDLRKAQIEYQSPAFGIIAEGVASLEPGEWTTYTDLGELAGVTAGRVGDFLRLVEQSGGHRVIQLDGRPYAQFPWLPDDVSPRQALEAESVQFNDSGIASPEQRVHVEDLRERLESTLVLPQTQRRAWLVRGSNVNGHDLVPQWLEDGRVTLTATMLREVEPGVSRDELKGIVEEDYAHMSYNVRKERLDELHAFLTRMNVGDRVATIRQGHLYLGTIKGTAEFIDAAADAHLQRGVDWQNGPDGVDFADLPADVATRLKIQRDLLDLSAQLEVLDQLLESPATIPVDVDVAELALPDASDKLAEKLHVDKAWLQECIDLLKDRPQLIFYGPPGTGKTYIAQHLAEHIAGDSVRLVQFHPAYSYEDFFEGYRPTGNGFELRPGPMRKIVDAAGRNQNVAHVLIIDEINRANLAKVFGELYFLLEYRDRNVDLLYATDDDQGFTLPPNVYVIGTMNTADRSIALVDAAMRRRFAFLPLHPSEPPTRGVLRSWLKRSNRPPQVADLLDELNARIEDSDFQIGPSYFMRPAVYEAGGVERTWRTSILPLLEEHHYGELSRHEVEARYGLDAVLKRVEQREQAAAALDAPVSAALATEGAPDAAPDPS
jgi:5-methylcytosine-specific restriction enzyme B